VLLVAGVCQEVVSAGRGLGAAAGESRANGLSDCLDGLPDPRQVSTGLNLGQASVSRAP